MEKDFVFGYHHHHHQYMMSPNPSLLGFPSDTGHLDNVPVYENPHSVEDSTLRNSPLFPLYGMQQSKSNVSYNEQNWLHRMPQFHNAFPPVSIDFGQHKSPTMGPTPNQRRFLVFDQSGDKTTLMCNSAVQQPPVQLKALRVPYFPTTYELGYEELRVGSNPLRPPSMNSENIESKSRDFTEDEMREDTEELNALLCSDNDYSEDDEETSTGHSPSTMTDNGLRDLVEEIGEEFDSFAGATKRQKLSVGDYGNGPSSDGRVVSSLKTFACSGLEDDAESSCGEVNKQRKEELDSSCGGKRSRRDKIHETLSVLQSIIPNVKGKDAVVVIDEAINHLISLKVKVKALGLYAL